MYREYFGLRDEPFSIAPDPRYLYMSEGHQEALAHLLYGINGEGGFVLLTGEVGTGKTTVCRCLLEQLPHDTDVAFILNPKLTASELLATVCDEFGIRYPEGNTSIKVFVDRINAFLLDAHAKGRRTVLIIEEAQNLSADVLEQVRLLTNLETNERKLLQIIMLGQPELRDMLSRPELRQLGQRITARYHLGPLSREEVSSYIGHRLSIAGGKAGLFPSSSIGEIFKKSGGIPRIINILCDRALLGTYVSGRDRVDVKIIESAAGEVLGNAFHKAGRKKVYAWTIAGILVVACVAAFAATFTGSGRKVPPKAQVALQSQDGSQADRTVKAALDGAIEGKKEDAYRALFKQWNAGYRMSGGDFCGQAEKLGLRCLHKRGSMGSLRRLNRPAVLRMHDAKGHEFYALLISAREKTAALEIDGEQRTIGTGDIISYWSGDYTLLWKTPPEYRGEIRPGSRGAPVEWLIGRLAAIRGVEPPQRREPVFDGDTVRKVKEFQNAEGLVPDGRVGPETIILLNNAAGSGEPLLTKGKG